ncbi:hypothetical protein V5O48_019667, partial [Marasmius crinis-equi]
DDAEVYEHRRAIQAQRAPGTTTRHAAAALPQRTALPQRAAAPPQHAAAPPQRAVAATQPRGRGRPRKAQPTQPVMTESLPPLPSQPFVPESLPPRVAGKRLAGETSKRAKDIWTFYREDSKYQRWCLLC